MCLSPLSFSPLVLKPICPRNPGNPWEHSSNCTWYFPSFIHSGGMKCDLTIGSTQVFLDDKVNFPLTCSPDILDILMPLLILSHCGFSHFHLAHRSSPSPTGTSLPTTKKPLLTANSPQKTSPLWSHKSLQWMYQTGPTCAFVCLRQSFS